MAFRLLTVRFDYTVVLAVAGVDLRTDYFQSIGCFPHEYTGMDRRRVMSGCVFTVCWTIIPCRIDHVVPSMSAGLQFSVATCRTYNDEHHDVGHKTHCVR